MGGRCQQRRADWRRPRCLPAALAALLTLLALRGLSDAFAALRSAAPVAGAGTSAGASPGTLASRTGAPVLGPSRTSSLARLGSSARRGTRVARAAARLDLSGKVALIAGVADTSGYGWAIAKELAEAGATILIGTWPPVLKLFEMTLKKSGDEMQLSDGSTMNIAKVYPLDAVFDTPDDVPDDVRNNKRYKGVGSFTIQDVVDQVRADFGKVDILVHSLANGPEVTKPLLETSRQGYLAASSSSAYSLVSMVSRFGPIMPPGGAVLSLTYIASERVIPGYGGGMSSAKAQLESDTRVLAYEAGRKYGIRVNTISAGPLKSRAASAIGGNGEKTFIERAIDYSVNNAPLSVPLFAEHVGSAALGLLSDWFSGVTGVTLYVDNGLHAMGQTLDSPAFAGLEPVQRTPTKPA
eukprot:TRINITY_DN29339_c0_g1_i1.p1 TRINITY_DN29339_c0_g1~~TRINITY_DN29339_c0_g1_i1.p1  ORF type:complete len:410 (+),score=65.54 TRINITY_DN29339_c0_g1_i1:65-1294(+)